MKKTDTGTSGKDSEMKVHYAELQPHEFRARLSERPLAYLPLGTLEWHGEHLPLGTDAIISEGIMVDAARQVGGIVMPPIHLGPDSVHLGENGEELIGMDFAESTTPKRALEGSAYWVSDGFFLTIVEAILVQLKRAGFKAVFAEGHGMSRGPCLRHAADLEARLGIKVLGVTRDLFDRWQSLKDHAALNETEGVMAVRRDLVDLSRLGEDRSVIPQGIRGEDPRESTMENALVCHEASVEVLKEIVLESGV